MAKVVNTLVRFLGYIGVFLLVWLQCYLVSMLVGGAVVALFEMIWSIIRPLPATFTDKFWLVYILTGAVIGTVAVIYITAIAFHSDSKKNNKQDN